MNIKQLPIPLPVCPTEAEHGMLRLRSKENMTEEQVWCGTWYDCSQCASSVLFESKELMEVLGP